MVVEKKGNKKQALIRNIGACFAFGLHQYATFCHIGLTHDSHYFLSAARSLATQQTLLNPDGSYFTNWTPLFPILLSPLPYPFLGLFQGIILFFLVFFLQKIAFEKIKTSFFKVFFSIILCFSPYLMLSSVFLWSENVFILLLILHFLFFERYLQDFSLKNVFLVSVVGFLLCLQRHAGLFFVLGTILYLLFSQRKYFLHVVLYLLFSLSGWVWWLWRNFNLRTEVLPSISTRMFEDVGHNLIVYAESISLFFLPNQILVSIRIIFLVISIFIILFILLKNNDNKKLLISYSLFITICYLFAMICMEKANFWEVERYNSVIYPFLLLNFILFLEKISFNKEIYQYFYYIFLSLWLLYPILRTLKNIVFWHESFCG